MMKILSLALLATAVSGYVAPRPLTSRPATQLQETFGLGIGEDNYANQPAPIAGEAAYKEWVNKVNEDNMLNRKVNGDMVRYLCRNHHAKSSPLVLLAVQCHSSCA